MTFIKALGSVIAEIGKQGDALAVLALGEIQRMVK
jgi:hypothetical protein